MNNRSKISRTMPIIIVVVIINIAIVALVSLARAMFGGADTNKQGNQKTDVSREALLASDLSRSVRMTKRGPIVANENHRSYQITVTPESRTITSYEGYLEKQLKSKSYDNNVKAYEQFTAALDKANLAKGVQLTGNADDTTGVCAKGNLYEFEILQGTRAVKRLWTTDCSGSKGSLQASVQQLSELFTNQVPNAQEVLKSAGQSSGEINLLNF